MCAAPENKTWFAGSSLAVGTYSIAPSPAASTATATPPPNRNAASTATAAAASSPTASAASAAPAASPVSRKLYGGFGCSDIFLVKDIERRQADIGNFLFAESSFVARCDVLRRHVRCGRLGCGSAARQRQRQPGGSQQGYGTCSTLRLGSLLRVGHCRILVESSHTFGQIVWCYRTLVPKARTSIKLPLLSLHGFRNQSGIVC